MAGTGFRAVRARTLLCYGPELQPTSMKAEPWDGRDPQWIDAQKDLAYWALLRAPLHRKNARIEKNLWSSRLDQVLRDGIAQFDWWYLFPTTDNVAAAVDPAAYSAWAESDPLCKTYAASSVLMNFVDHHVWDLGLRHTVKPPAHKACQLCGGSYLESSVHRTFASRLRYRANVFCGACSSAIRQYALLKDRKSILHYIREIHEVTGVPPPLDFGMDKGCVSFMKWDDVARVLLLLRKGCPDPDAVKREFGSWFDALDEAGLLPEGVRTTARGYQCRAKDGHVCLSLGERVIDDFLHDEGIEHEREPRYPFGRYRADFKIGAKYVEYAGLAGDSDYDKRLAGKLHAAKGFGIDVIVIFPHALSSRSALRQALGRALGVAGGG